ASALQRIQPSQRWAILEELLQHEEDRDDHNLPLMYWYAAEPLAQVDAGKALQLALKSKVPMLDFMVRRIAALDQAQALEQLIVTLGMTSDVAKQKVILQGLLRSLQGRRQLAAPASWPTVQQLLLSSTDASLKLDTLRLGTFFGDEQHIRELVHLVQQGKLTEGQRQASLQALLATRHPEVGKLLLSLLQEESLRTAAIRGLAAYERAEVPQTLLALYSKLTASQKRDAVGTLAARPSWARELLLAVQSRTIPL
ncbi:MAG TPA: hypothetical protein PKA06_13360, partial [Gemmatales bacterium]|nr:hypothetical protein [Gemmatales bacterium]